MHKQIKKPIDAFESYSTKLGLYWLTSIEDWLSSDIANQYLNKIDLVITSPPFPLNRKKKYGNRQGEEYINWLSKLAPKFRDLLTATGSLVIEIGNAWNPNEPTMSTLPIETLLALKKEGQFSLCQEFICHNPARLPSPAQYVNIERERIKDSWTKIWWLAKNPRPKANNKNILIPYSPSMKALLKKQSYNFGKRPSEHKISKTGFLKDHGGSIPASYFSKEVLEHFNSALISSNTKSSDKYLKWCKENNVHPHPARMQEAVLRFFISFLTEEKDLVFDPFSGSNTTGWIAEQMNRRWISVEIKSEYYLSSKARFFYET